MKTKNLFFKNFVGHTRNCDRMLLQRQQINAAH